ncbi:hypothetical protein AKJ59_00175 [candidate division MSBL1 archaeon SCGC-AAA385M02]|uniref:Uncharacterized protein n=1 Tax=candidate division MSBL1 archaeon SCGC-AAA385M02 TaxID=1698287 RepID=A0A133VR47_9EURY|nr:hypothetical protein AKJ59_00175 [candidate division MSBL1 archaeon SCGC-AAA385M02]
MSMNIKIKAVAKAKIISTGEEFDDIHYLSVYQTPTKVTERIMRAENRLLEYEEYVTSISVDEVEPVFAEDDIFQEKGAVGYRVVNNGKDHLTELHTKIAHYSNKGYEIIFEAM